MIFGIAFMSSLSDFKPDHCCIWVGILAILEWELWLAGRSQYKHGLPMSTFSMHFRIVLTGEELDARPFTECKELEIVS